MPSKRIRPSSAKPRLTSRKTSKSKTGRRRPKSASSRRKLRRRTAPAITVTAAVAAYDEQPFSSPTVRGQRHQPRAFFPTTRRWDAESKPPLPPTITKRSRSTIALLSRPQSALGRQTLSAKQTEPCVMIGNATRPALVSVSSSPAAGPGAYNSDGGIGQTRKLSHHKSSPNVCFASAKRIGMATNPSPGPVYAPKTIMFLRRAPQHSIPSTGRDTKASRGVQISPGPVYDTRKASTKITGSRRAPVCSFGTAKRFR